MSTTSNNQTRRGLFSFLGRGQQWLEISGYHVGDIQSDKPVAVTAGATLWGNVFAPKITVAGLLSGAIIARETIVQAQGQVWGDVYSISLRIEPGGKIRGWVSNLDEAGYESLLQEGIVPDSKTLSGRPEPPAGAPQSEFLARSDAQIDAMRRLQTEAATALAARAELEQTFEHRLSEESREASARAASLHEELNVTRIELATLKKDVGTLEENLRERDAQINRQTGELAAARESLTEQSRQLNELHETHERLNQNFDQLQTEKRKVDAHLQKKLQEAETLTDRVHSLETALQDSLQHTAEQEESLVRWQELAEVTEARVRELEREMDTLRRQLEDNTHVTEMLREQRKQTEKEFEKTLAELQASTRRRHQIEEKWQKTMAALEESTGVIETLREQRRLVEEDWQKAITELDEIRHGTTRPLPSDRIAQLEDRIEQLESDLAGAEENTQEYHEQVLWHRASLETARTELNRTRQFVANQEALLVQLQTDVAARQALAEKWQAEAENVAAKLDEQEKRLQSMQADVEEMQGQAGAETTALQESMRQSRSQLEASEKEAEHYWQQMEAQGKLLAEIRATLVEHELQLKQARATITKQQQFIKQMQTVTGSRIKNLEAKLARAQEGGR